MRRVRLLTECARPPLPPSRPDREGVRPGPPRVILDRESGAEAQKCVLLCSNCHAEVEHGELDIDDVGPGLRLKPGSASTDARAERTGIVES